MADALQRSTRHGKWAARGVQEGSWEWCKEDRKWAAYKVSQDMANDANKMGNLRSAARFMRREEMVNTVHTSTEYNLNTEVMKS